MNCTCGNVQSFLTPCIQIVSILNNNKLIQPSMIPIIWWYIHQYYYNSEASAMAPNINEACRTKLQQH